MVAKVKTESKVKIQYLEFSRDCSRLLMIGDLPDYKIQIYDLEKKKMLTIGESLKDKEFLTASFNPADPSQFLICC